MSKIRVETRRLTGKDATRKNAARYVEMMRQLTTMPADLRINEAIRFIAGSVPQRFYMFGAFVGDELIAVVNIHIIPHLKGLEARVEDVVTHQPFRKRKAFRQLHAVASRYVRQLYPKRFGKGRGKRRGIYKMTLASKPDAEAVYLKMGYERNENEYAIYFLR